MTEDERDALQAELDACRARVRQAGNGAVAAQIAVHALLVQTGATRVDREDRSQLQADLVAVYSLVHDTAKLLAGRPDVENWQQTAEEYRALARATRDAVIREAEQARAALAEARAEVETLDRLAAERYRDAQAARCEADQLRHEIEVVTWGTDWKLNDGIRMRDQLRRIVGGRFAALPVAATEHEIVWGPREEGRQGYSHAECSCGAWASREGGCEVCIRRAFNEHAGIPNKDDHPDYGSGRRL